MNVEQAGSDIELSKEIKKIVVDTLQNSTSHGLPNIFKSSVRLVQVMWLLFLLGSTGLCVYMVLNSILNYLQFDVVTKIREINELPSDFPAVTICNMNRFTTDYSLQFLRKIGNENDWPDIFNDTVYESLSIDDRLDLIERYRSLGVAKWDKLNQTEKRKFSYDINDIISDCQYVFEDCNSSDFIWIENRIFGGCYTFNSGFNSNGDKVPLKKIYRNNFFESLYFNIFIGIPDNLAVIAYGVGSVLYVHNQSSSSDNVNPINLSGRSCHEVSISREYTNKLPSPYSDCSTSLDASKSELYNLIINSGNEYSQLDCINQCYQKFLLSRCNCTNSAINSLFKDSSLCTSYYETVCAKKFYIEFTSLGFVDQNCLPLCPLECSSKKYKMRGSSFVCPMKSDFEKFSNLPKMKQLYYEKKFSSSLEWYFLSLNIYYDRLTYTQIDEVAAMDFVTLLSNVGGIAGLFLGISVLSFVEVFELLCRAAIELFNHRQNKKIKPKPNAQRIFVQSSEQSKK